jgi:hypothetical protein
VLTLSVSLPGLGVGLSACGTTSPGTTLSQQVTAWAASTGFSASVTTVRGDVSRVAALRADPPPGVLKTDCDVLVTDSLMANQNLPTPDPLLTDLLSAAYSAAGSAGHDCFDGAGGNSGLLARSTTERAKAATDLIKAEARYDAVTTGTAGG